LAKAMNVLLDQSAMGAGQWSEIPTGTRMLGLKYDSTSVTIDFSEEFIAKATPNTNVHMVVMQLTRLNLTGIISVDH